MLAVARASEICIGIVCAGIVLAGTDFGGARRRLAGQFAALAAEIAGRFSDTFSLAGPTQAATRGVRRGLVARVVALGPFIDEAIGEASDLRYRARGLQAAVDGLIAALSGWRTVANCLERLPDEQRRRETELIVRKLPQELRTAPVQGDATTWADEPSRLRLVCRTAVRSLVALPADTPSRRLMADATAGALLAMSRTLDGLALLGDPGRAVPWRHVARFRVPDLLPACINATRVFATIAAAELFWIATAWPNGTQAITLPRSGSSCSRLKRIRPTPVQRCSCSAPAFATLAGIVDFALLPGAPSFVGFSLAIGLILVPVGSLLAQSWQRPMFAAMAANFIPLVAPANQMTYDTIRFYNAALGIIAGMGAATIAMLLVPPLSPALRVRRLLILSLRDLRRLAATRISLSIDDWEGRIYGRLSGLPADAEPLQLAQLVAALSVGTEIIRLRRVAYRLGLSDEVDAALEPVSGGEIPVAIQRVARIDRALAAAPSTPRSIPAVARHCGSPGRLVIAM